MDKSKFENDEALEFDYYLKWKWPAHIERTLRRMVWMSLVEASEPGGSANKHTAYLRLQIAKSKKSPPAVLDFLANLHDPSLLARIAANPQTWAVTLARLARHEKSQVRQAVSQSANVPFRVIQELVTDDCLDVRHSMAMNPALPERLQQHSRLH